MTPAFQRLFQCANTATELFDQLSDGRANMNTLLETSLPTSLNHVNTDIFPRKPYCSDDLASGLVIRPRPIALSKKYIQINDLIIKALILDLDYSDAGSSWIEAGIARPSWVCMNRKNGHAHLAWLLKSPIPKTPTARQSPIRYFSAIEYNIGRILGADPGYAGLVTKNPLHSHWKTIFHGNLVYSLDELSAGLDLEEKPRIVAGVGRNVTAFDTVRKWAYVAVRSHWKPEGFKDWSKAVEQQVRAVNGTFSVPLPESETRSLTRSISKWVWNHCTPGGFNEEQSRRGKRSGEVRRKTSDSRRDEAKKLREQGLSIKVIAEKIGVTRVTVSNLLKDV